MTDVADATATLLEDRPELEDSIETLLDVDSEGVWTFEDVPLDSGTFGEIVSQGLVEETEDGYRIADRDAVQAGLEQERTVSDATAGDSSTASGAIGRSRVAQRLRDQVYSSIHSRTTVAVVVVLLFVAVIRIGIIHGSVLRNGDVVLASNDPYAYWRLVEQIGASNAGLLTPSDVPQRVANGDVLFVMTIWWVASLTGMSTAMVLAWYPVIAAVLGTVFVALLVRSLTNDYRIVVAAPLMLGITPVHAFRTALGFGDHDAFDLLWLTVIALTLVVLARRRRGEADQIRTALATATLGSAVATQVVSWRGGGLYLLPVGLYVVLAALDDIRADRSPMIAATPLIVGLGLASGMSLLPHGLFGWLPLYRALIPLLLLIGTITVVGVAEAASRLGYGVRPVAAVETGVGLVGLLALLVVPLFSTPIDDFLTYMGTTGARSIAETGSLIGSDFGSLFGPVFLFGLLLFVAIPSLALVSVRAYRRSAPGWLVLVTFAWCFLVASVVQMRFAVALSPFAAVFAGAGFVHLAHWVDLARPVQLADVDVTDDVDIRLPDTRQIGLVVVLFLLVGSFSFVQIPVKMQQVAIDDGTYQTGSWIGADVTEQGLTYPNDTVATDWDRVRMYNYLAGSARSPENFGQAAFGRFARDTNATRWYHRLGAGYVVLEEIDRDTSAGTVFAQLADPIEGTAPLSTHHYRLVYARPDADIAVYRMVPGARIRGTGPVNGTIDVTTNVTVRGRTYQYEESARADENGTFSVIVPYPGDYRIGNRTVTVPASAVDRGNTVRLDEHS